MIKEVGSNVVPDLNSDTILFDNSRVWDIQWVILIAGNDRMRIDMLLLNAVKYYFVSRLQIALAKRSQKIDSLSQHITSRYLSMSNIQYIGMLA